VMACAAILKILVYQFHFSFYWFNDCSDEFTGQK